MSQTAAKKLSFLRLAVFRSGTLVKTQRRARLPEILAHPRVAEAARAAGLPVGDVASRDLTVGRNGPKRAPTAGSHARHSGAICMHNMHALYACIMCVHNMRAVHAHWRVDANLCLTSEPDPNAARRKKLSFFAAFADMWINLLSKILLFWGQHRSV